MDQLVDRNRNENARGSRRLSVVRTGLMTLLAAALTGGMTLVAPSAAYAADVQFADANLAACVAENLSLDPATTTFDSSALAAITSLDCFDAGIEDLGGIEALVGLEALDVSFNAITDLGPLGGLERLAPDDLDASFQEVDWRIPAGSYTEVPLNPWFDGDSFHLEWSNGLSYSKWKFKPSRAAAYEIWISADDYDFDVTYNVRAYSIKKFSAPKPKITGTAAVGKTLTAKPGTWKPSTAALTYQWYRSGKKISGATAQTYTLTKSDLGKKMTVKVTGKQAEYKTATVTSKSTGKVKPGKITAGVATLSGTPPLVGQVVTVTADAADWSPTTVALSYQWYRSGKAIKGAKAATYTPVAADKGKKLSVKVSGKLAGYSTRVVTLNAGVVLAGA